MDLKKFLPKKESPSSIEYLWALVIEPGWVQSGIWYIGEEKAHVVEVSIPTAWEGDDLVDACDASLSSAIQNFSPEEKEPQKTVFGVTTGWVKEGEIKEEILQKLKVVCSKLSLTPVGFVVLPEAITHLIKSEEGSPVNAVVLGVYKETLELSVFRLGRLSGSTQIARSVSIVDDVVEGLTRLSNDEPTPSRFLIYDGREGELEEAKQNLLKANWEDYKDLKFLHTPKVEIIDVDKKVNAVSLAGASEIANVKSLEIKKDRQAKTNESEEVVDERHEVGNLVMDEDMPTPEELGFEMDKDIGEKLDSEENKSIEEDFSNQSFPNSLPEMKQQIEKKVFTTENENMESTSEEVKFPGKKFNLKKLFKPFVSGFIHKPGKMRIPKMGNKPFVIGIFILIFIVLGGFAAWWFLPRAEVTLYVAPQKLEEKINFSVDQDNSSDTDANVLAGKIIGSDVSGEKTKGTTGTKTVGEKANGEVTIYRVGVQINLLAGTLISGPSGLKYSLADSITVASGSAGTPGTTTVKVVAEDIGSEYNLASDSTFAVSNYSSSDMEAKNETAFSGGSSREINAVSEDDQETLKDELMKELGDEALNDLEGEVGSEEILLTDSKTTNTSSFDFSNKVGDEADTLKLSMELSVSAIVINKEELEKLAEKVLKEKVPEGFTLRKEQIDFEIKSSGGKEENTFEARASVNLLPQIDIDVIKSKIKGKYPKLVEDYLKKEASGFSRAEIKINPALTGRLRTLPHVASNIDIEISAEK